MEHFVLFRLAEPVHGEHEVGAPAEEEGTSYDTNPDCDPSLKALIRKIFVVYSLIQYYINLKTG